MTNRAETENLTTPQDTPALQDHQSRTKEEKEHPAQTTTEEKIVEHQAQNRTE